MIKVRQIIEKLEQMQDKWGETTWKWSCKLEDRLMDSDLALGIFCVIDEIYKWMVAHETLVYVVSSLIGTALGIYVSILLTGL